MTERNPFEHKPVAPAAGTGAGPVRCEQWEELLADALDGLLPASDRAAFDAHAAACPACAQLLAQATQGREWLGFLTEEPEIPAGLVERIVSRTSGSVGAGAAVNPAGLGNAAQIPALAAGQGLAIPVRRAMWDSRMVMTAAMAFFSLALTFNLMLNLAGVRLTDLHMADLNPSSMEMNLTRQFYGAKGSVVRYYDNLRLVYEVESRVRQVRRADEAKQAPQPKRVPANPKANNGSSHSRPVRTPNPATASSAGGVLWGVPQLANTVNPAATVDPSAHEMEQEEVQTMEESEVSDGTFAALVTSAQAERSLA